MQVHKSIEEEYLANILALPDTLEKLTDEGVFFSLPLSMPSDIASSHWNVLLESEETEISVIEVYTPKEGEGWAVCYKPLHNGYHTGKTEIIYGRWEVVRETE